MKRNIYIMYMISLLQGMVFYGPIATLYRQAQGIDFFQISIIESILMILCLILEIPWGIIGDRIGYKKTMVICCFLYFASKIIFWKATDFTMFLLERIVLGISISGISGIDVSIIYLSCHDDSQKFFGIYNSLGMIGLLFAAIVFSVCIGDNYSLAAFLTVVSYGISAILSLCLVDVHPHTIKKFSIMSACMSIKDVLCNRSLFMFLLAIAFLTEIHQTITVFLSQLQYEKSGMNDTMMGMVYVIMTVAGMGGFYSSKISRRIGQKCLIDLTCLLFMVSCLILAISQSVLLSIISILVLNVSFAFFTPLQMKLQNQNIHTENRATMLSIHTMLMNIVALIINLVFGYCGRIDICYAFVFGMIMAGLAFVLMKISYLGIVDL